MEFKLADIGEGIHEGEILRWLVKEGDQVEQDAPLVEVQTDKVTAELPSPVAGVIERIMAREGQVVPVGTVLAVIREAGAKAAAAASGAPGAQASLQEKPAAQAHSEAQPGREAAAPQASGAAHRGGRRRALATPHVRALARKLGVDIDEIDGTGPVGRVTEEDVRRFAEGGREPAVEPARAHAEHAAEAQPTAALRVATPAASGEPVEQVPLRGLRRRIAEHMVQAKRIIPHATHIDEVEMDGIEALRERLRPYAEARGVKLTSLAFFVKAVAIALKEFPYVNASVDEAQENVLLRRYYHIGIAVDTEQGLIVPVVKHADEKSVFEIAREVSDLARRARENRLSLDEVTGSTFTISNAGALGGLYATPIINYPESAILGIHKMEPRPVVRNNEIVIRNIAHVSLSFDHRIIDGGMAIRFTNRVRELLEEPDRLWAELR
ncbi:dihydrolipoamide acetyltransferase family protein [Alicyclobacillus acidocaldarius]|uniref:Dihydrolipoamide acetyltransferase component of pyruvate dehydrogenase complex n=1 Tax=Alicyclobacillus acidocaldarius subsp. acidocaldarius (strain ATCC 27009 / DSM 446 / BCRC 14685 / JCM 5260 / KCTC 1825 / NBRC 15652 / NCIMB 11725 / NRRL B-14509 / 104-IA) TaxID=521098 RepID=C8WUA6_ALIAD|nr:dihydrolipoamide acetyltransferase family protein [Alicyclobacillus acidocaldarius]ACV57869.1 catalytic domain of components of various dehydrogenase complexes [Alicyclobacillus acidocaldarius subsp. acidocaldarius DSM 446]